MRKDRLRRDRDEIHNLDDLIEARTANTSRSSDDVDSLEDIDLSEDTDVDEALTFPHPKHKKPSEIELMDTHHKDEMEDGQNEWARREFLPSDYSHDYSEATSTSVSDDQDEIAEERVHEVSYAQVGDVTDAPLIEQMPRKFTPDEETPEASI